MEYARDLLVAACSRERADVTPHAVWGKNWDRWLMDRLSTDLTVDVHPFAGTPMAKAMEGPTPKHNHPRRSLYSPT